MNTYDVDLERGPVKLCGRYSGYAKQGRYNAFTYDKLYDVPVSRNTHLRKKKSMSATVLGKLREWKDCCNRNCSIQ